MPFCPAALPLSSQTLTYAAGIIRRHRTKTGSCWRKLNPGRQALLVLARLRTAADRPFYSGKHRRHGMNLQVISASDGEIRWVSGRCPAARSSRCQPAGLKSASGVAPRALRAS